MKDHIHLFIIFTLLQLVFSVLYFLLTKRIGTTLLIGTALYGGAMTANYFAYRASLYQKRRKEMLDALP